MARIIDAFTQFFDDNGEPLVNGKLYFYESGTNNTPKDTFADINELIANSNPVILDGAGRAPNIFGSGAYNIVSANSADVQMQQFDPVIAGLSEGAFADWNAVSAYSYYDIVSHNNLYYRSLINNNQGNDPSVSPTSWEQITLIAIWNSNITYSINDNVIYNGVLYRSRQNTNLNKQPDTQAAWWEATGGSQMLGDAVVKAMFYNAQSIDEDITVAADQNALSSGPITIEAGRTVTITSGGRWAIV